MSWFGSSKPAPPPPSSYDDTSSSSYDTFAPPPAPSYSSSSSSSSSGRFDANESLEQALLIEQQRAAVTAAISKLTELCFAKCISRPDAKLSSSETQCIVNTADRYLDASMYVMGRLTRQGGGGGE